MPNMCYSSLTIRGAQSHIDRLLNEIRLDRAAGERARHYTESFTSEPPRAGDVVIHHRDGKTASETLCGLAITWPDREDGDDDEEDDVEWDFCERCSELYEARFGSIPWEARGMLSFADIIRAPDGLEPMEEREWQIEHWDTKSDLGGSGSYIEHEAPGTITIALETAWAPPLPIVAELARQAPELLFMISWHVEPPFGIDGDVGEARWENGEPVLQPPQAR